jgi:hypothetical protein
MSDGMALAGTMATLTASAVHVSEWRCWRHQALVNNARAISRGRGMGIDSPPIQSFVSLSRGSPATFAARGFLSSR